jgi:Ca-activated chloride channel family protein
MKDDLEEIRQVLRHTPELKADKATKQAAISMALSEFDKNNLKISHGSSKPARLKDTANAAGQFIFGSTHMKKYQLMVVGAFCALFVVWVAAPMHRLTSWQAPDQAKTSLVIQGEEQLKLAEARPEPALNGIKRGGTDTGLREREAPSKDKEAGAAETIVKSEEKTDRVAAAIPEQNAADLKKPPASIAPAKSVGLEATAGYAGALQLQKNQPEQADDAQYSQYHDQGRDKFKEIKANPLKVAKDEPVSTFSIDVDTASYGFVRSSLNQNILPQKNAVRVEELINYFPYEYSSPGNKEEPFKANVSVFPTPWNKDTKLMHIGIKGYQLDAKAKPRANLVFLIDTSGSMNEPNKLPLVQNALKMLLDTLGDDDSVAIVTYAGNAGVALQPTKVKDKSKISSVIDNLGAAGSTAGAEGIRQAYQLAEQNFDAKGINRVILATDGDFNVGITDSNELKSFVERKRSTGVTLSVLGFGSGNYNDEIMQTLAQNGNGNAAYIDTLNEARKALVEEAGSTLFTIAKDVKIQVEFNPAQVAEYRLIGYETRLLNTEDFNNDKVDAGDIGSGHSVTALYEITPVASKARLVDEPRYREQTSKEKEDNHSKEYAFVKIRYKLPDGDTSKLITTPVDAQQERQSLDDVSEESRFAAAVAAFGQLLRGDAYLKNFNLDNVIALAESAKGTDKFGYRSEFINLVRIAKNAPALPPLGH